MFFYFYKINDYCEIYCTKSLFFGTQVAFLDSSFIVNGKELVGIPSIVFMECFHALVKAFKYKEVEVKKRLVAIIDSKNINVLDISTSSFLFAFEIAEKYRTGGRDSLIAASLLENKIQEIYSHDSDFNKIMLIKRIDPI